MIYRSLFAASLSLFTAGSVAPSAEPSQVETPQTEACEGFTCYYVCEYTLYTTWDQCMSECGLCDRFCI